MVRFTSQHKRTFLPSNDALNTFALPAVLLCQHLPPAGWGVGYGQATVSDIFFCTHTSTWHAFLPRRIAARTRI